MRLLGRVLLFASECIYTISVDCSCRTQAAYAKEKK